MAKIGFEDSLTPYAEIQIPDALDFTDVQNFFVHFSNFLAQKKPYVARVRFLGDGPKLSAFLRKDVIRALVEVDVPANQWCQGTVLIVKNVPTRIALQGIFWAVRPRHPWLLTSCEAEAELFLRQKIERNCQAKRVA